MQHWQCRMVAPVCSTISSLTILPYSAMVPGCWETGDVNVLYLVGGCCFLLVTTSMFCLSMLTRCVKADDWTWYHTLACAWPIYISVLLVVLGASYEQRGMLLVGGVLTTCTLFLIWETHMFFLMAARKMYGDNRII